MHTYTQHTEKYVRINFWSRISLLRILTRLSDSSNFNQSLYHSNLLYLNWKY